MRSHGTLHLRFGRIAVIVNKDAAGGYRYEAVKAGGRIVVLGTLEIHFPQGSSLNVGINTNMKVPGRITQSTP